LIFLKAPSALIGSGEPIVLQEEPAQVEYEAEIGVVIGSVFKRVQPGEGEKGIQGLVCINDVTARDVQRSDGQWTRAKGFDTFCPAGPEVVTGLRWQDLELVGRVNGIERQRARSSEMVFSIPQLLSYISGVMTLFPGDLI